MPKLSRYFRCVRGHGEIEESQGNKRKGFLQFKKEKERKNLNISKKGKKH